MFSVLDLFIRQCSPSSPSIRYCHTASSLLCQDDVDLANCFLTLSSMVKDLCESYSTKVFPSLIFQFQTRSWKEKKYLISLFGELLQWSPVMAFFLQNSHWWFQIVEHFLTGFDYPDESLQAAICFYRYSFELSVVARE
jgi:hypothetical protein